MYFRRQIEHGEREDIPTTDSQIGGHQTVQETGGEDDGDTLLAEDDMFSRLKN